MQAYRAGLAVALFLLISASFTLPVQAQSTGPLLPDLQTLPPTELSILVTRPEGKRLLRLTNSIANLGAGPLELQGISDPLGLKTLVIQRIRRGEGAIETRQAGVFIYHPGHHHWHFENFVRYELWTLETDYSLKTLVAVSEKVSYCLRDNSRAAGTSPSARMGYIVCDQELQGLSPGWVDTYTFDRPGQIVDITGLPNGWYALRSIVDPANQILELNEVNNAATQYIAIQDSQVRLLEPERRSQPVIE